MGKISILSILYFWVEKIRRWEPQLETGATIGDNTVIGIVHYLVEYATEVYKT